MSTRAVVLVAAGLRPTLSTTEPGLRGDDGRTLDRIGQTGLGVSAIGPHSGIVLEPQAWPDAPNQPWSTQALLRPGETYCHLTRLVLFRQAPA